MHPDEVDTHADLVRRLLLAQHPQWADLPIERVISSGTDNAMYRLGDHLVARLPRIHWAVDAVEKEHRWLPFLAPQLPLPIPTPLAKGAPAEAYPYPWSVYTWLDGENAFTGRINDLGRAARDVAGFMRALQAIDTSDGPRPKRGRGTPLANVDEATRRAIIATKDLVDSEAVTAAWETALRVPNWSHEPVWFHADIASGNLLVRDGHISAVIDFSGIGVGDPACDLTVAWDLFDADSREVLRRALDVDDDTWARGRGWALCTALWALPYYLETNSVMVEQARRKIAAVLAEQ